MKKTIRCLNADCTISTERRGMKRHLESCAHTEIPCKYRKFGCDVMMKRDMIPEHEESEDKLHLQFALDKIISLEDLLANEVIGSEKSMTFKVTEFSKKKDKNEVVLSPAFYAGVHADNRGLYLMQIQLYTGGTKNGRGECITAYFKLLEGRHDDELNWPFTGTVTLKLLNQQNNASHDTKQISFSMEKNARIGYTEQLAQYSHSNLGKKSHHDTCFLKDDTLYFNVSVKVTECKPWLITGAVSL
jgi:hypothetical protein